MLEGVFLNISNIEWIEKLDCLTDLHVHLDGSLSLESVRHLCGMQNIETGDDAELSAKLSVSSDCKNLNEYLEKFTDADVVNTEGNLTIDLKDSGGAEAGTVILAIDESSSVLSATLKVGGRSFGGNATVLEDIKAPVSSESYSGMLFFGPSDNGSTAMTIEFKALESDSIVITLYTNYSSGKGSSRYSSDLKGQDMLQYSDFLIGNDAKKPMDTLGGRYRFASDEDGSVVFYDIDNKDSTYHMTRIM